MKILKIKLFQESACYKKPFAFKVAETYPLPPYSTVIGMFHKILQAKPGEYFPMNISIQGNYESIFNNYQTLRMFKGKEQVTTMPRNVHQLLNVDLLIHVKAQDDIIDKIYENVVTGKETFTLGRNEDLVRIDEIKSVEKTEKIEIAYVDDYNAYVPVWIDNEVEGINYRLNTTYEIKDDLRQWKKVDVKYIERHSQNRVENFLKDEDGDCIFFYERD